LAPPKAALSQGVTPSFESETICFAEAEMR